MLWTRRFNERCSSSPLALSKLHHLLHSEINTRKVHYCAKRCRERTSIGDGTVTEPWSAGMEVSMGSGFNSQWAFVPQVYSLSLLRIIVYIYKLSRYKSSFFFNINTCRPTLFIIFGIMALVKTM